MAVPAREFIAAAGELVAIRSTADRPGELRKALDFVLGQVGPGPAVQRFESRGKPSALVWAGGPRPHFRVLLNAHVDVVPAPDEQFRARLDGDRLYGRGTQDMKLAALVLAQVFRDVAPGLPYPVGLQLVTDEEVGGHDGTAHQIAAGVTADFVVIGEQSGLRIVTDSKGILQVRLHTGGTAAHAAYPWLGDNALLRLTAAIDRVLARHPVPAAEDWATTVNVARIETGNRAVNQVPAEATAWLDIRFPPDDDGLTGRTEDEIRSSLKALSGAGVTVDSLGPPHHADPDSRFVALLRAAAREAGYSGDFLRKHGAADGRFYYAAGTDAVIFGPGGAGQHGPAEFADLTTVEPYRRALTTFLTSCG
ncbi:M20 family metallopeptidase [Actinoplanes sp. N902-109]|uniref:M20 family metallopeptidase n=1 Tax=Actinoplanes sp. (strain N902-109) TaxID=649831 RepID=UPI0003293D15|nr:M20/M25/M40 family metallo-hydrolase [Actinoplanes sp. N902-109]AGL17567.1 acetylornithine deacetylase/Succinyl- diaminopimelate desuccinylase-like protein [Actinoplanes sp. N902-109]